MKRLDSLVAESHRALTLREEAVMERLLSLVAEFLLPLIPGAALRRLLRLSVPVFALELGLNLISTPAEPELLHIAGTQPSLPHLHHQIRMFFRLLENHETLANTVLGQVVVTDLTYHALLLSMCVCARCRQ